MATVRNQTFCPKPLAGYLTKALLVLSVTVSTMAAAEQPSSHAGKADGEKLWWSLQPLRKPNVPAVANTEWPKTAIDRFILAKLEEKQLAPSPEADPVTLLRRVTYSLTGLPPAREELDNVRSGPSSEAYEKAVDRLLASPRYGERWARHWLDLVHYADTHGHDQDRPRNNAWPYRDYLVRSFNSDKPYARFVEEQLAGDVLYPRSPDGVIATGFIAAGPWDESSQMHIMADTVDKKIAQSLDRDDMVATAISTFVSTTVHCARCHDHKFDPIPQEEYYQLQAVFAGVDRTDRPFDRDSELHAKRQALLNRKTAVEIRQQSLSSSHLDEALERDLADGQRAWEQRLSTGEDIWIALSPETLTSSGGATLVRQADQSVLALGCRPGTDTYTVTARTPLRGITALQLEVLPDERLPERGPGWQDNGNFHLSEFQVEVRPAGGREPSRPILLRTPTADFSQAGWEITKTIDGKTNTAWGIHPEVGKAHRAVFELKDFAGFEGGTEFTFVLHQLHGSGHLLGRFRIALTTAQRPIRADPLPGNIAAALAKTEDRAAEQMETLAAYYRSISPELQSALEEIDQELASLSPPQWVYAAANNFKVQGKFTPAKVPRPIYFLARGEVTRPGDLAKPGALSCVEGLDSQFELERASDEGARRAALARWITDPKNVLTWRSIVNRVWHYHFGRGLVATPNDFGRMGAEPSHPELLDWLALYFLESGGSFKQLHKLILTSAVYRQTSAHQPDFANVDTDSVYLWRMNRSRLDAESLRDSILFVSGKLDFAMGGPSVMQFHFEDPDPGVTPKVDYERFDVDSPASLRRGIYRWIFRTLPDPFMDVLDCADSSQLTPVRNSSVTPLQALSLLNNAFVLRQCEHFAARLEAESREPKRQIELACELAFGRKPDPDELEDLSRYAAKHGLPNLCRLIFNSNEFMFVN